MSGELLALFRMFFKLKFTRHFFVKFLGKEKTSGVGTWGLFVLFLDCT